MSNSLSFELTVPLPALLAVCADLAPHLGPGSCTEDGGPAPGHPPSAAALAAALQAMAHARAAARAHGTNGPGDLCLTVLCDEDEALRQFRADEPDGPPATPGQVAVGCFWTGCWGDADGQALTLCFTSATHGIAQLMRWSPSVRARFLALARHAVDGVVRVVDDWQGVAVLA